jgi:hypothetical protein
MILIIDKQLKDPERKLLDSHCSVYEVNQDDLCSWIDDLPKVDIYVVNINDLDYCERSYGMCWLEVNMNGLEEKKIDLVYYRKTSCIEKKNLPRLKSYIIKTFPIIAKDKDDLQKRLKHHSLPYVRSSSSFCCACMCSKISMGACLKGCLGSLKWLPCV